MENLREGIAKIIKEINTKSVEFCPEVVDDEYYTDQILLYLNANGVVKLAENQELPEKIYQAVLPSQRKFVHAVQQEMSNFKRVEEL